MILLVGDMHVRKEEPFYQAVNSVFKNIFDWTKEGDTILQLGDFFHTYKPFPKEYALAVDWLHKLSDGGRKVKILAGNNAHEYHYQQKTYAIEPLASIENVEIITTPKILTVENVKFLCFPWMPQSLIDSFGKESLEDLVVSYIKDLKEDSIDYVLYHFEDETVFMGGINIGINLSELENKFPNIKRIGGHIHLRNKNYIGTPYQTRADEINQTGICYLIENGKFTEKEFPQYISYMNLEYSEEVPEQKFAENHIMLNVKNAPSVDNAYSKFKKNFIYINNVDLIFKTESNIEEKGEFNSDTTIKEFFQEFSDINKIDKKVSSYLKGLL